MKKLYQIKISEIKGKLNIGKNPWYIEIPLTIFIGIPLILLAGLFWLIGNGFHFMFVKPFEKEKTWSDLKWSEFAKIENLKLEKSEPINEFLDKKGMEWFDEDPVFAIRTNNVNNPLAGKLFSNFFTLFDNKIFLQEYITKEIKDEHVIKSKLISVEPNKATIKEIKEFEYYYIDSQIENSELIIKGKDQIGSKFCYDNKENVC